MIQMKHIAAGISAAFALGYGATAFAIPFPSAVADSLLTVSNFTILSGDGVQGRSNVPLPLLTGEVVIDDGDVSTDADVSANIGGGAPTSDSTNPIGIAQGFVLNVSEGAGFVANQILPFNTVGASNFAGSHTSTSGNALDPTPGLTPPLPGGLDCGANNQGDCVSVHNQVNLVAATSGTSFGNQNLDVVFQVVVTGRQTFELAFDADGFLRAALGQQDVNAKGTYNWQAKVVDDFGNVIFQWDPNGTVGTGINAASDCLGTGTCVEFASAFNMNDQAARLTTGDTVINNIGADGDPIPGGGGALFPEFEAELILADTSTQGTGSLYTFSITHKGSADATVIPEPGSLALLGAGLMGIAARRRKTA